MGQKLPPRELELYNRCDEVLFYMWDPIGVVGAPSARDEYYAYLPEVFTRVRDNVDSQEVVDYLLEIEEKQMSLRGNRKRARRTVDVLYDWREWIWGRIS